jgi:hypothetical protein
MTHKVTSLVKGLQLTDHGAAGSPTAKVSSEESPAFSIQASTDADQDSEASATSTTTTTTADATPTPSSSVKIVLKVDALIDVYSEKTVGVVNMKILPHDVELPALNKDNKEIAFRFMWIDDPNATNPLGIANDVSLVCLILSALSLGVVIDRQCKLVLKGEEDQKTTATFDIKAGAIEPQDKEGVSLSCTKVAEKLANIKDGL